MCWHEILPSSYYWVWRLTSVPNPSMFWGLLEMLWRTVTHNLSLSFADCCHRWISPVRREMTDAYCRSEYRLRVSHGSSFRLYSSFESLSRRQSFQPSGETTVLVDSSTARLIMRRRASLVPFLIFVRFGAHSIKTFPGCGDAGDTPATTTCSLITDSRLLPAHCE